MTITPRMKDLLDYLTEVAERGEVCPRNPVIAEAIGAKDAKNLPMWLGRLEREGYVGIERFGFERVVTITSNGKATAMPVVDQVATQHRYEQSHKSMMANRGAVVVMRDPCFKCGARRDYGCSHYPKTEAVPVAEAFR